MKRTTAITLALCVLSGMAVTPAADARTRPQSKTLSSERTVMPPEYLQPHKFDRLPKMQFFSGRLQRDNFGGWRLGDYELQTSGTTVVTDPSGADALLEEGREAVVMGVAFGQVLAGWNVRMTNPDMSSGSSGTEVDKRPSDVDPDVGEIIGGPR
jgi:hypothetical protein